MAIFDIGKTNKKFFLFNEQYQIAFEQQQQFEETVDEDGFACDDVLALANWVRQSLQQILLMADVELKAINFSTYGASFVYVNNSGEIIAPLYNYLKPFNPQLKDRFYLKYGSEELFAIKTASPVLGNLNSGLQIYRLKHEKPELFSQIKYALHLPQYMSYLITGRYFSDITSIGCHTGLWNFPEYRYHDWVHQEGISDKLAPIYPSNQLMHININDKAFLCGTGLHDSSAALIPYLANFSEPFILISTGTWCISLNPFNNKTLTVQELQQDCLCYMEYRGKPVKASRLFAGYEHEQQIKRLSEHFNVDKERYKTVAFNTDIIDVLTKKSTHDIAHETIMQQSLFAERNLTDFKNYEEAYHQLILDLVNQQVVSTNLILQKNSTKKIFVDGGFSKNPIYMNLLANAYPTIEVYASEIAQATAIGAAMAVHKQWNTKNLPPDIIQLKKYTFSQNILI
ncbi:MAG: carbohydrate kinase [Pedobacter sp.]|nr:carbohydrate kinase [Chitinophagaceae bacterium]